MAFTNGHVTLTPLPGLAPSGCVAWGRFSFRRNVRRKPILPEQLQQLVDRFKALFVKAALVTQASQYHYRVMDEVVLGATGLLFEEPALAAAAGSLAVTLRAGIAVIEINPCETAFSPRATHSLRGGAGEVVPALLGDRGVV